MIHTFQFTPFTCALACFESLARDLGIATTQADILQHHRDICWNQGEPHTYGAIDADRLRVLSSRYLLSAETLAAPTKETVTDILSKRHHGILICCHRFCAKDNANHCIRAESIVGYDIHYFDPSFPFAFRKHSPFDEVLTKWSSTFIDIWYGDR